MTQQGDREKQISNLDSAWKMTTEKTLFLASYVIKIKLYLI